MLRIEGDSIQVDCNDIQNQEQQQEQEQEKEREKGNLAESDLEERTSQLESPAASFHSSDPRSHPQFQTYSLDLDGESGIDSKRLSRPDPSETNAVANSDLNSNPNFNSNSNSNSLLFTNLPSPFFTEPTLASSLLDLLNAYGSLVSWNPIHSLERATVVYEKSEDAKLAKDCLDRLLLLFEDEEEDEQMESEAILMRTEESCRDGRDEIPRRGRKGDPSSEG